MPSILIADDDPDLREILTVIFRTAGLDVITATNGSTALQLTDRHRPNAILADYDMPGLNGVELCHAIREQKHLRSLPIAILTGYLTTGDTFIREINCCTVLFQPRSNKDLVAIMLNLIEKGSHEHDWQGRCLTADTIDPILGRQLHQPGGLMFSPPPPELRTTYRPHPEDDVDHADLTALPPPHAHPNDPRISPRSPRIDSTPPSRHTEN